MMCNGPSNTICDALCIVQRSAVDLTTGWSVQSNYECCLSELMNACARACVSDVMYGCTYVM